MQIIRPSTALRLILPLLLAACATPRPAEGTRGHLGQPDVRPAVHGDIPAIVGETYPPLRDTPRRAPRAFSLAVDGVPVRELLLTLARDAATGIDIHPDVGGSITLHAGTQPLPRLLDRIARQARLRIDYADDHISVEPDVASLRFYPLDYVNITRQMSTTVATTTQIAAAPTAGLPPAAGQGTPAQGDGSASLRIDNRTRHHFWEAIEKNVRELLRETDKPLPDGSSETTLEQESQQLGLQAATTRPGPQRRGAARTPLTTLQPYANQATGSTVIRRHTFEEAAAVILHPETGLLSVRATQRQHERIREFLERVLASARRQVMIEATIVEVELGEGYRHGIDWSRLRADGSGFAITRPADGSVSDTGGSAFSLVFKQLATPLNLVAAIDLLQSFGTTKVLSSPRLSVLNNQTALLKVVENIVYFNVKADTTSSATAGTTTAVTTTPQSVSVGLVMSVTPQISDTGSVMLNIRPSISSVSDWKQDPNPSNKVANFVPQIRTREIESIMRINHGDIAVLGGLMEDGVAYHTGRVPLLGQLPVAGELLTKRDNSVRKSELVIFLRPTVIQEASLRGDYASQRGYLPDAGFFAAPAHARPLPWQ